VLGLSVSKWRIEPEETSRIETGSAGSSDASVLVGSLLAIALRNFVGNDVKRKPTTIVLTFFCIIESSSLESCQKDCLEASVVPMKWSCSRPCCRVAEEVYCLLFDWLIGLDWVWALEGNSCLQSSTIMACKKLCGSAWLYISLIHSPVLPYMQFFLNAGLRAV